MTAVTGVTGSIQLTTRVGDAVFAIVLDVFRVKKCYAELRRELVTGYTVRRYEQLETFPVTIKQELRPAGCEHRQTDLRRIIV